MKLNILVRHVTLDLLAVLKVRAERALLKLCLPTERGGTPPFTGTSPPPATPFSPVPVDLSGTWNI